MGKGKNLYREGRKWRPRAHRRKRERKDIGCVPADLRCGARNAIYRSGGSDFGSRWVHRRRPRGIMERPHRLPSPTPVIEPVASPAPGRRRLVMSHRRCAIPSSPTDILARTAVGLRTTARARTVAAICRPKIHSLEIKTGFLSATIGNRSPDRDVVCPIGEDRRPFHLAPASQPRSTSLLKLWSLGRLLVGELQTEDTGATQDLLSPISQMGVSTDTQASFEFGQ
jgi:hypothetical protein